MTEKILIVMPTRGRPWSMLKAVVSILETASKPDDLMIMVCADEDDPIGFPFAFTHPNVNLIVGPRARFVEQVNYAVKTEGAGYAWVAWCADDARYRSTGWDDLIRQCPVGTGIVWPGGRQQFPFVRTAIPESLGFLLPPHLVATNYAGFIWRLGIEMANAVNFIEIEIEHLGDKKPNSCPSDETNADVMSFAKQDFQTFAEKILPTIPELAKKALGQ